MFKLNRFAFVNIREIAIVPKIVHQKDQRQGLLKRHRWSILMDTLSEMFLKPISSIEVSATIDSMLNVGDFDGHGDGDVTCKQTLTSNKTGNFLEYFCP